MTNPGYAQWANFYHGAVAIFSGSHSRRTQSKAHSTAAICRCCAARWLPPRQTAIDFSKLWFWQSELGNFPAMGKRKKKNWSLAALMGLPLLLSVSTESLQASSAKSDATSTCLGPDSQGFKLSKFYSDDIKKHLVSVWRRSFTPPVCLYSW